MVETHIFLSLSEYPRGLVLSSLIFSKIYLFMTATSKYKIVIADDHEIFRRGLTAVLGCDNQLSIVGEANNGVELMELLEKTKCDIVIVDLSMPIKDGYSILEELSKKYPGVKRLVLSMHKDKASIKKAMAKGIDGFVNKEGIAEKIVTAVSEIRSGKKYYSDDIKDTIISIFNEENTPQTKTNKLTKREKEIAKLVATGLINKEIADSLHISLNTVQYHRSNIKRKLDIKNSADLTRLVLQNEI